MSATTPRCFVVRHGETEWSLSGKHTGTTDLPLTPNGEKRAHGNVDVAAQHTDAQVTICPDIAEWNYGDYEGITSAEIRQRRREQGLDENWDIWRDGCPNGESPSDIVTRVDRLIAEIRTKYHAPVIGKPTSKTHNKGDVMVVAHGHILRAFAIRWIGKALTDTAFIMEPGGVGTLSYEHHNINEPAILLGGGFVVGDNEILDATKT
ncbi:hypothetical protein DV737_g669, partial [Chaetothyriales sp. CBS 132003]